MSFELDKIKYTDNVKTLVDKVNNMVEPMNDMGKKTEELTTALADTATKAEVQLVESNVNNLSSIKADVSYVNTKVQAANLSYKESYATLTALQTAYPTGDAYNHAVLSDGMIYTYFNNAWTNTLIQANGTGFADASVTNFKIPSGALSPSRLSDYEELFNPNNLTSGGYYSLNGTWTASANVSSTPFYDVPVGTKVEIRIPILSTTLASYVAFKDESGAFTIGGIQGTFGSNTVPVTFSFVMPIGAKSFCFDIWSSAKNNGYSIKYKGLPLATEKVADKAITTIKIDDKAITTIKIDNEAVSFNKLKRELTTPFDGYKTTTKPNKSTSPCYLELVFDLQPYTLSTSDKFRVDYDFYAENNILNIGSRIFLNNDARVGFPSGGVVYSPDNADIYVADTVQHYSKIRENYISTYRYAHVFITPKFVNTDLLTALFFRNLKLFVGSTEIAPITGYEVYNESVSSPVVVAKFLDNTLILQKYMPDYTQTLNNKTINKWYGKKANFLGTSITFGAVWNGSTFFTTTKPYHYWLGQKLGLSVVRNYGISSSTISAMSTNPINNFLSRYSNMDVDADLIVVECGPNDKSYNTPLGTMSDTTDVSYYGALHVLIKGLTDKYPGKRIVFMTPLRRSNDDIPNNVGATLKDYRDAVLAKSQYFSVATIDTYSTSGLTPFIKSSADIYLNDLVHPTELGHELLADNNVGQFQIV